MANLDKLNSITTNKSNWLEEAKKRQKNKEWLKDSQRIAIKVLSTLKEKKMSQIELAGLMGVSAQQVNKIVKGKENMTLETLSKLNRALGVKFLYFENTEQTI